MELVENDDIKEASTIPSHFNYVYSLHSTARNDTIWRNNRVQTNLEVQFLFVYVVN